MNNLLVVNYDPLLGGKRFEVPPWTPNCPFLNAVKETPESSADHVVIPWDYVMNDYVYAAIPQNLFQSYFSSIELKREID